MDSGVKSSSESKQNMSDKNSHRRDKDLQVRANDGRIPLENDRPTSKEKVVVRGSIPTQNAITEIEREGRRERSEYKKACARERSLPGLSKEDKKHMREVERTTLNKMKYDNMRRQAECYAESTGQTLPKDMSYNDLKTTSIRCFLPQYTRGEDLSSAITHIIGGALGIIMLIVGIYYAAVSTRQYMGVGSQYEYSHPVAIATMFIFALGAIFLYVISTIYHFLWVNDGKKVLRIIDHCTIYFLIAASYTPIVSLGLPGAYGMGMTWVIVVLAIEWGLGIALTVFNCLWLNNKLVVGISMAGYIILGWMIIAFTPVIIEEIGMQGFLIILFGGIAYTIGAICHGMGHKVKYMHTIAHALYVVGTLLHFIGILVYFVI